MKKRFVAKHYKKKKFKFKFLLFFIIFIISLIISFKSLLKSDIKVSNKKFVEFILDKDNIVHKVFNVASEDFKISNLLYTSNFELEIPKKVVNVKEKNTSSDYLIYVYNTHQKEEYASTNFIESEISPTVMMSSYIMKNVFDKNKFNTLVEERSISDLLSKNNWKYYRSYDASRIYLDDSKQNNPTLKYFIDVHRDSLERDKTTVTINDKSYAKVIFLIGLENPNYNKNLEFTTKINDKLNEKYPGLSKGIYKKGGVGVNGVYNQDNSEYTILIEIGGVGNNTTEVLNSTLAFCDAFMEVINNENETSS